MSDLWIDLATEEYENTECSICGADPMTTNCNNANCVTTDFDWSDEVRDYNE